MVKGGRYGEESQGGERRRQRNRSREGESITVDTEAQGGSEQQLTVDK